MATVSNFVGILTGQDKNHHPIISLVADTPTGPQPVPPIGLPSITIVINGEKGQLLVGGASQPGSIQVLNPAGKPVITLESDPDGNFSINNPLGAPTIRLSGKGASGWFGGAGIAGDVLVFGADAKGTSAADAAVWIKGATGDVVLQNADCAEDFEVQEHPDIEPGVILCLSEQGPLMLSSVPYDRKVARGRFGSGRLAAGHRAGAHEVRDQSLADCAVRQSVLQGGCAGIADCGGRSADDFAHARPCDGGTRSWPRVRRGLRQGPRSAPIRSRPRSRARRTAVM